MNESSQINIARVFFALWPNDAESNALSEWQNSLHALYGGLKMRSNTLHLTLAFLGNIENQRLEIANLAAQEFEGQSFDLTFNSAHYWEHNHIVYAAPKIVPAQLAQLVNALEQRLHQHGFSLDKRDYKPHVTLLRRAKWQSAPEPKIPEVLWRASSVALMKSEPDENGTHYRMLASYRLQ
jgi:2'-5' RNA ligase